MRQRRAAVTGVFISIGFIAWAIAATAAPGRSPSGFELRESPILVGPMTGRPTLADLDADGDLDVVVTCGPCCGAEESPDSGHVQVLLNDGTGKLTYAGERIKLGGTALGSAVGDVNDDGIPDIVAHHHSSYEVAVLLGQGAAQFSEPTMISLYAGEKPHVHSIALSDVNNDGHLDVLATLVDDHALSVLLGDGEGRFSPALGQPYFAHLHPYAQLNPVDINGDANVDVVLTDVRGNGLTVLVGSGTGMFASSRFRFAAHTPLESAERPLACALADLDQDGDLDVVAFIDESPLAVRLINEGDGVFREPRDARIDLACATTGGTLADLNGDGHADLVASGTMTEAISISFGRGDGAFAPAFAVACGGGSPAVSVGDMNGDGRPDLITGNYASGTVSVLINAGVGSPN